MATRGNSGRSGSIPPAFGRPPAIQRMRSNDSSAFSAASALVALESLTIPHPAPGADQLAPVRQPRIARERRLDLPRPEPEAPRRRIGGAGVLVVVRPRQRRHLAQVDRRACCRPPRHSARKPLRAKTCQPGPAELARRRDGDHRIAGAGLLAHGVGEKPPLVLVDPDDRPRRPALGEEPPLRREIAAHAAVPVEVVGREVEKDRDVRLQRPRQLDLVGRELEHHHHAVRRPDRGRGRLGRCCRPPAPAARPRQQVREQRRRRRLAVRAGDADDLRHPVELVPVRRRERAEEEADVVVDRDARRPRRRATAGCGAG